MANKGLSGKKQKVLFSAILPMIIKMRLTCSEYNVFMFIIHKIWGEGKEHNVIAVRQIMKATGLAERTVRQATKKLKDRRLIDYGPSNCACCGAFVNEYRINEYYFEGKNIK